jgi:predicted SAM-dependent methyltransferase
VLHHRLNAIAYKLLTSLVGAGSIVTKNTPRRDLLANLYLEGEGVEIGALNSPLALPRRARARYVDYRDAETLREQYPGLDFKAPDIVDDARTLATLPDSSQDFVIACHIIEHMEDPIGAIKTWLRVLKPGGVLFIAIPDRRFTFDFHRDVTEWAHMVRDHEEGPEWSREAHYEDSYRKIFGVEDEEEVRRLVARHRDGGGHTHFHVWTQVEMLEFVGALRRYGLDFEVEGFFAYGNEGVFILRKGAREDLELARSSLEDARQQV